MAIKKEVPKRNKFVVSQKWRKPTQKRFLQTSSNLMCFTMPYAVIKFEVMMFFELIYHFVKTQLSFAYQQWLWVIVQCMLLEIFTDSLCSKPAPPSLDIFWCKVLLLKTWTSAVFGTVFLKKIENYKFSIFFLILVP